MMKEHQIKFFKRVPLCLLDEIRAMLKEATFMSVTFDSLNASVGEYTQLQGAGVILIWFWDHGLKARKVIYINLGDKLIAQKETEEWLDISIKEPEDLNLPFSRVSFSINSSVPDSLKLDSFRFFSRVSHELVTGEQETNRYKHFLHQDEQPIKSVIVEHDFVNWIVLSLKGGHTIILERGDQIGTFYLYFDDMHKLGQINTEAEHPDWGSIKAIDISF
jgi:hypothetical protein